MEYNEAFCPKCKKVVKTIVITCNEHWEERCSECEVIITED